LLFRCDRRDAFGRAGNDHALECGFPWFQVKSL
jgi:hypothetical protein